MRQMLNKEKNLLEDIAERLQSEFAIDRQPLTPSIVETLQRLSEADGDQSTPTKHDGDDA
jgi:hypothetical protein